MIHSLSQGALIWITGLPGAGKTTTAKHLYELVKDQVPTVCIDGDVMRELMGGDLGYTDSDRLANAYRIARLCKHLVDHRLLVICSTVSLYKEIHEWIRTYIAMTTIVLIDVDFSTLVQRDQKGMYSQALAGQLTNVRGVNQAYDIPEAPEFTIQNNGNIETLFALAPQIMDTVLQRLQVHTDSPSV